MYEIALAFARPRAAVWACILTTLTPFLIWISRETLLDYWIAAWVAGALALLLKTSGFESTRYSFLLGLAYAFGMLTKWIFAGLIIGSMIYVIVRHQAWSSKRRIINCVVTIAVAVAGAGIWYIPNLPKLFRYFLRMLRSARAKANRRFSHFNHSSVTCARWRDISFSLCYSACLYFPLFFFIGPATGMAEGFWELRSSAVGLP